MATRSGRAEPDPTSPGSSPVGRAGRWIWWLLAAYAVLLYVKGPFLRSVTPLADGLAVPTIIEALEATVGLALIVSALWFLSLLVPAVMVSGLASASAAPTGAGAEGAAGVGPDAKLQFPHQTTVAIGLWLAVLAALFIVAMMQLLSPSAWMTRAFPGLACVPDVAGDCTQTHYLAVTMVAAGIGSMATTILGYLEHVSEKADFQAKYVPWYVARPVLGMLLGAIFFFVMHGGLLATVGQEAMTGLNVFGLAGVGAMVGLFSKPAVEKLREVFAVLFYVPQSRSRGGAAPTDPNANPDPSANPPTDPDGGFGQDGTGESVAGTAADAVTPTSG